MTDLEFLQWLDDPGRRPLVMGVLNVTPDSFSDGGRFASAEAAVAHAHEMAEAGADLIDIGGESTRPGSPRLTADEQISRILPVFTAIKGRLPCVLSIDTTRSEVARAALDHGALLVNDISGSLDDPGMLPLVAQHEAPVVLMHMQGQPATMQANPHYEDVVGEVAQFLRQRLAAATAAGVAPGRVLLDPGIGFGKGLEHNLLLLRDLRKLADLGRPLVLGTSRKAFVGRITGETQPADRLFGTAATVAWCAANGAGVLRVHDVKPMLQVVRMVRAIQQARMP